MSGREPGRWTGTIFDFCVGTFVAALALYGAVFIISAIWVRVTIIIAAVLAVGIAAYVFSARFRRW